MKKLKSFFSVLLVITIITAMCQVSFGAFAAEVESTEVAANTDTENSSARVEAEKAAANVEAEEAAAEQPVEKSGAYEGTCGANVTYSYDPDTGILTISGTGEMSSFSSTKMPWYSYKSSMTTVIIEEGVTSIGSYAFYDFTNITSVEVADTVELINSYAFNGCTNLASVNGCNGLKKIDYYSFCQCSSLLEAPIGSGVTEIEFYAFRDCDSLTKVTIPAAMPMDNVGSGIFADCDGIKEIEFLNNPTYISDYLFERCTGLETVVIPDTVEEIKSSAFSGCSNLENIIFSSRLKTIDYSAFEYCTSLSTLEFPDTLTTIRSYAFFECTGITSVKLNDNITDIDDYSFDGCSFVIYGGSVHSIANAFAEKRGFTYIPEDENVYYNGIGDCGKEESDDVHWNFNGVTGTLRIYGTGAMKDFELYNIGSCAYTPWERLEPYIKTIVVDEGITYIGSGAFYQTNMCRKLYIPDSLKSYDYFFHFEEHLYDYDDDYNQIPAKEKFVIIGSEGGPAQSMAVEFGSDFESNGNYYTDNGKCGDDMYYTYDGKTCKLSITGSGEMYNFYDYWEEYEEVIYYPQWEAYKSIIKSVNIAEGPETIGSQAFYCCISIESLSLSSSIKAIGDRAFNSCANLGNITFKEGLEKIDGGAFGGCAGLTKVVLPNSLTYMGYSVFSSCGNLKEVVLPDNLNNLGESIFEYCNRLETVHLPANLETLPSRTFVYCNNLHSVKLPENLKKIDSFTFAQSGLRSLVIPNSVTTIGEYAFEHINHSLKVVIPESVTEFGSSVFYSSNDYTTIYGYTGSAAEEYATSNSIKFVSLDEGGSYEPKLLGCSVSLAGEIMLNYYFDVCIFDQISDMAVKFCYDNGKEITTQYIYDANETEVGYVFSCPVPAAKMGEKISAYLIKNGEETLVSSGYSIQKYAETIVKEADTNTDYAKAESLVKAMLNYGAYSEITLYNKAESTINSCLAEAEKTPGTVDADSDLEYYDYYLDDNADAIEYVGSTISLKSKITIRHYFKIADSVNISNLYFNYSYRDITLVKDGKYYRIDIEGISAQDINSSRSLDIYYNVGSLSLSGYSVCTYIKSALKSDTISDDVKDTVTALYTFGKLAQEYSNS